MTKELITNFTIIVTCISISYQILKDIDYNSISRFKLQIIHGIANGIMCIMLTLTNMESPLDILLDLRNMPIFISAVYGGPISAIITVIIASSFSIFYSGSLSNLFLMLANIAIQFIGFFIISRTNLALQKKWITAVGYMLIVGTLGYYFFVNKVDFSNTNIVYFWIGTIITVFVTYRILEYSINMNKHYRQLKLEASKDFLTGLNNVRKYDNSFNTISKIAEEQNKPFSLLILDIDKFKKVNDTYGHSNGDLVLKELSGVLSKACRNSDVLSRIGGEEFSILLMDCNLNTAFETAERIRKAVQVHNFTLLDGRQIKITVSIGISAYPETTPDIKIIKEQADYFLYQAKRNGRNRVIIAGEIGENESYG